MLRSLGVRARSGVAAFEAAATLEELEAAQVEVMGRKSPVQRDPEVAGRPRSRRPHARRPGGERGASRRCRQRSPPDARRSSGSPRTPCSTPTGSTCRCRGACRAVGSYHPLTIVEREIVEVFTSLGFRVGGGARGRGRLAQLPGAQHPSRPSRAHDEGLPVRERAGASGAAAADRDVGRADPHDAVAAAARLRCGAGARLPPRDGRPDPPARLPSDRGAGGGRGHHVRRPQGHPRGDREGDVR